jgi:hypothetical protein
VQACSLHPHIGEIVQIVVTEVVTSYLPDGTFNYQQVTGTPLDENGEPTRGTFILNLTDSDALADVSGGNKYEVEFKPVK